MFGYAFIYIYIDSKLKINLNGLIWRPLTIDPNK